MKSAIAIVLAAAVAGCGGTNLSFSVRAGAPVARTVSRAALAAGSGITLTRLRIVIRKVELEKAGTLEMDEIASGPYLLDLSGTALDNAALGTVVDASFTPGTYDEIKLEIHKPENTEKGANADLKDMIAANASIIADGTIDGATFTFTTAVSAAQKFEGNMVLKDGSNLTLNVDATSWFTSAGTRLDPRTESNRSQIENNIQQSFKAFKDDDRDGQADL
jgi:hypothetical protein